MRGDPNLHRTQSGQVLIIVVLMLGVFLLVAVGIAVDLGNLWFHRQNAQVAADAACTAGVMDMLQVANGALTTTWWTTSSAAGSVVSCATTTPNSDNTVPSPCWYAAKNGYASPGLLTDTPSNAVTLTMRSSGADWGATVEPGDAGFSLAGTAPFLQVNVVDRIPTYFFGLFGQKTMDAPGFAGCGLQLAKAPIPIIVLDPSSSGSMSSNGTGKIKILGGPSQSIQVNSSNSYAVAHQLGKTSAYGGPIDLTDGGPKYAGSSFGVTGGPFTAPSGFTTVAPGQWMVPTSPISDPFAKIDPPPLKPGLPQTPADLVGNANCTPANIELGKCTILYGDKFHGCPQNNSKKPSEAVCTLYTPGDYPDGIAVKGSETAVFDPGVYYLEKSLFLASNSIARTSTVPGAGDGSGGTMFYLTGAPSGGSCKDLLCIEANSGKTTGGDIVLDTFDIYAAQCPGGAAVDPALIAKLNKEGIAYTGMTGNLLLGPCTGTATYPCPGATCYGDPSGMGQYRGMVFFADRSKSVTGSWSGGGSSLMAGNAYFHHSGSFDSQFVLTGGSGSDSYVMGEIVTDRLDMGGTPAINMVLNPNASYPILKAALMQ